MSSRRRAAFVALVSLLRRRHPDAGDPEQLITAGRVLVDGAPALNPRMRVRSDAAVRLLSPRPLRGAVKLAHALTALTVDVRGLVAVDLGAAAGGFTQALLEAGAARVYAVDAGVGQLRGFLRVDPRVVNLEHVNLAALDRRLVPEPVELLTIDLSYLALSGALTQLGGLELAPGAQMVALVKPTFELRLARLAASDADVEAAVLLVREALAAEGWRLLGECRSPVSGARGAREAFVHARWGGEKPAQETRPRT